MPRVELYPVSVYNQWALWHIQEGEEELEHALGERPPEQIQHTLKRLEWMAARLLLRELTVRNGLVFRGLAKDENGKPFLPDQPVDVSLSHSYPFVAAQIRLQGTAGIDLEQPKEKLLRIGPRFLSARELQDAGHDRVKLCVYWCAKEVLFKVHSVGRLPFATHLWIEPFSIMPEGLLTGWIEGQRQVNLQYCVRDTFVCVLTR